MKNYLLKKWFLVGLVVMITAGLTLGSQRPEVVDGLTSFVKPRLLTACVLFLMSITLDSKQLQASFRSPAPVLMAIALNYIAVPLLAWGGTTLQLLDDFAVGLMIAGSVPCTMAAASVWTRKAGGNDAVSLLVTMSTNAACFAVTPLWINLSLNTGSATLDTWEMVERLFEAVLIPCAIGQLLRLQPRIADFATRNKPQIGGVAQSIILVLVLFAALKAGDKLNTPGDDFSLSAVAMVWGSCIAIHLAVLSAGHFLARTVGFSTADAIAVAFAGSQKTLPIGVLIATDPSMFGNYAFAVFPMLMYHASQLFIDTAIADRWARDAADAAVDSRQTGNR